MGAKDSLMGRLLGNTEKFSDKQVAETLDLLVEHGLRRAASDIHIEPHERFVLVRYRIDGALRGMHKLPRACLGILMAQLKELAGLDVQETHMPQEGEYVLSVDGNKVEVRLSLMPVYGGEKAVLHLSLEHGEAIDLADLGFWGQSLANLRATLASPHGLVLVAGPRQSGLTTTLFSLLQTVNSPMLSIATIEPTPAHRLPGVNHTYLTGNMSPHTALEATLKQDPNIIMLGNLTDGPTAELAVHAATTGHLVLGGVHAESSIAALLRLRHGGVEPFLLASALKISVGQHLVRRLCPECRERYTPSEEELAQLQESFGMTTAAARKRVHELEREVAPIVFGDVKQLSSTPTRIAGLWRASAAGCQACDHSGYQGRTAIVEVLANTNALHKLLLAREPSSTASMQAALVKEGFIPMGLDGLVKALRGLTTVAEVLRAVNT